MRYTIVNGSGFNYFLKEGKVLIRSLIFN